MFIARRSAASNAGSAISIGVSVASSAYSGSKSRSVMFGINPRIGPKSVTGFPASFRDVSFASPDSGDRSEMLLFDRSSVSRFESPASAEMSSMRLSRKYSECRFGSPEIGDRSDASSM